jgi:hypothetical protein
MEQAIPTTCRNLDQLVEELAWFDKEIFHWLCDQSKSAAERGKAICVPIEKAIQDVSGEKYDPGKKSDFKMAVRAIGIAFPCIQARMDSEYGAIVVGPLLPDDPTPIIRRARLILDMIDIAQSIALFRAAPKREPTVMGS